MSVVFFFGAIDVVLVLGLIKELFQAVQEMLEHQQQQIAAQDTALTEDISDAALPALPELEVSRFSPSP